MQQRIFGLENEYGLIFSPNGKIYLPLVESRSDVWVANIE